MGFHKIIGICAVLAASGCSQTWSVDTKGQLPRATVANWRVVDVNVTVPTSLSVSEQNSFAPSADIVWHGDPPGNRRAQVDAIVTAGISAGAKGLRGGTPVRLNVQVTEFHAVTPRATARAPSAVNDIAYIMQAVDARSGKALTPPIPMTAHQEALTGDVGVRSLMQGNRPKDRIIAHLAAVTAGWLRKGPDQSRTFQTLGR